MRRVKITINPLLETVKEPLREIVLAALPGVLVYLQKLNTTWAVVLYLLLRTLDQYLHELGKTKANDNLIKGLTRF